MHWARHWLDGTAAPDRPQRQLARFKAKSTKWALRLWREARPAKGTLVETYLASRGLGLPSGLIGGTGHSLRFHPECPRGEARLPAMLGLMRGIVTDRPVGVHRTFLRGDGLAKAAVEPNKMMLGRSKGAVLKLSPDEDVTLGLGLAEGIEDGLAVLKSGFAPVWVCLSAGAMASFPVLGGVKSLSVFRDNDAPGAEAAAACVERWQRSGKEARVVKPPRRLKDSVQSRRNGGMAKHNILGMADRAWTERKEGFHLVSAESIEPEDVRWLWPHWLSLGKLHLLAGAPGTGKTTIAVSLAAAITSGGASPDGGPDRERAEAGDVLIWSGEDGLADTLMPRFLAAGGDRRRLHFAGEVNKGARRPFNPATDLPRLIAAAEFMRELKLVVLDPVVAVINGDSHKNSETRRDLQPVVSLAEQLDVAVLGITDLSKGSTGREPLERVMGSIAFAAVARVVLATVKPRDRRLPHRLVRAKSNLGLDHGGIEYSLAGVPVPGHDFVAQRGVGPAHRRQRPRADGRRGAGRGGAKERGGGLPAGLAGQRPGRHARGESGRGRPWLQVAHGGARQADLGVAAKKAWGWAVVLGAAGTQPRHRTTTLPLRRWWRCCWRRRGSADQGPGGSDRRAGNCEDPGLDRAIDGRSGAGPGGDGRGARSPAVAAAPIGPIGINTATTSGGGGVVGWTRSVETGRSHSP